MDFSTPTKQAKTLFKTSPSSITKDPLDVAVITNAIMEYLPEDGYLYFAPVNTVFEQVWLDSNREKKTAATSVGNTETQLMECHDTGLSMVPYGKVCTQMVKSERLDLLIREIDFRGGRPIPLSIMEVSALIGNLEITEFIYNGFINQGGNPQGCYIERALRDGLGDAFYNGVKSGNVKLVEWFLSKGCTSGMMDYIEAVKGGHISILEFFSSVMTKTIDEESMSELMDTAVESGNIETIKFLQNIGGNFCEGIPTISAVHSGDVEILKYVVSQGAMCWEDTVGTVGVTGKVEFLDYMKNNPGIFKDGGSVNDGADILYNAVTNDHRGVMEWCHANGYMMHDGLCELAVIGNNLEMLKWLRAHGCPFGSTGTVAKKRGYIKIYMWAKLNGCVD